MKSVCFVFAVALLGAVLTEALICDKWTKKGSTDVVIERAINCSGVCVLGAMAVDKDLNMEGDCSHENAPLECQTYTEDGHRSFACACNTEKCNTVEELLDMAKKHGAAQYLELKFPEVVPQGNHAETHSVLVALFTVLFGTLLTM